jgi:hypothetical protein
VSFGTVSTRSAFGSPDCSFRNVAAKRTARSGFESRTRRNPRASSVSTARAGTISSSSFRSGSRGPEEIVPVDMSATHPGSRLKKPVFDWASGTVPAEEA